jgi:hypothetical protein
MYCTYFCTCTVHIIWDATLQIPSGWTLEYEYGTFSCHSAEAPFSGVNQTQSGPVGTQRTHFSETSICFAHHVESLFARAHLLFIDSIFLYKSHLVTVSPFEDCQLARARKDAHGVLSREGLYDRHSRARPDMYQLEINGCHRVG